MDDIEDLIQPGEEDALISRITHSQVVPRAKMGQGEDEELKPSEYIEGTQSVYVKTWGCSHNNSDGEYMAGLLAVRGYNIVDCLDKADLCVLNSCTVKSPSEQALLNAVSEARSKGIKVVVAGCVPQGEKKHEMLQDLSMIGVQQIDQIVPVVDETLKGHQIRLMSNKRKAQGEGKSRVPPPLNLPKVRKNKFIEILPINSGCLNQCTYCKTKHARGDLRSYPIAELVERVRLVVEEGIVREFWITSEDTGAYGRDIGTSLPKLLWAILKEIPSHMMLRLGMTNPPYILEHLDEMVEILHHPRVYTFLHIPIQAASDTVLDKMKREYTRADFCRIADKLLENVPDMHLATDIICGFPSETREDFQETVDLVAHYKFPTLHISQFYPRRGTPAARMRRVKTEEVKRRSRDVSRLFNSYETRSGKVGRVYDVLCTEEARDGAHWVAHNKAYDQILIAKSDCPELAGKWAKVKVYESGKFFLKARILSREEGTWDDYVPQIGMLMYLLLGILFALLAFYIN